MVDIGDAYYPSSLDDNQFTVPKGRYTAVITDLSISEDVKFGKYKLVEFIGEGDEISKQAYLITKKDLYIQSNKIKELNKDEIL